MWSGPRNISTAMMYAFGNRPDTQCWDEPFYGFALATRGNEHPMRQEIIDAWGSDWNDLVRRCLAPPAAPKRVFYQKHMTHHMLEGFDRRWIGGLTNAFLIRAPEQVLQSYVKKWSEVSLQNIGFAEQGQIFEIVADRLGKAPPVIDAEDVLADPRRTLTALCKAVGIPFDEHMLAWPEGPKPFDGVWAPHWYNAVWRSTGFEPRDSEPDPLTDDLRRVADEARPYYEKLSRYRL
jgi:hypothetical protein